MKEVFVVYTGTWTTTLEVPDDWELTIENAKELIESNERDFDFQDGGADWRPYSAEVEGQTFITLE